MLTPLWPSLQHCPSTVSISYIPALWICSFILPGPALLSCPSKRQALFPRLLQLMGSGSGFLNLYTKASSYILLLQQGWRQEHLSHLLQVTGVGGGISPEPMPPNNQQGMGPTLWPSDPWAGSSVPMPPGYYAVLARCGLLSQVQ